MRLRQEINERELGVEDSAWPTISFVQLVKANFVRYGTHKKRPYEVKRTTRQVTEKTQFTWPSDNVTIVSMAQSRPAQRHGSCQPGIRGVKRNWNRLVAKNTTLVKDANAGRQGCGGSHDSRLYRQNHTTEFFVLSVFCYPKWEESKHGHTHFGAHFKTE